MAQNMPAVSVQRKSDTQLLNNCAHHVEYKMREVLDEETLVRHNGIASQSVFIAVFVSQTFAFQEQTI
jgi:hypothetical protein